MHRLAALLFLVLGVCAAPAPARAALVYDGWATGPGGLSTPYPAVNPEVFAGFIEFNYNGVPLLAMSDDYNARSNVGESWPTTLYTYADVMAGAPVRFSPQRYSEAGWNFSEWFSLDPLRWPNFADIVNLYGGSAFAAQMNLETWQLMNHALSLLPYQPGCFANCQPVYSYDWSNDMIVASGGPGRDEYLIPLRGQNITIASAPVPSAAWLLGSGLLGLVGVARKKHKVPH